MPTKLNADVSQLAAYARGLNLFSRFFAKKKIRKGLEFLAPLLQRDIVRRGFAGKPYLNNRSGRMAKSIKVTPAITSSTAGLNVTSDDIGIAPQVFGAVIVPRNAKALAVPTASGTTGSGDPRWPSPLDRTAFAVVKIGGQGFLMRKDSGEITHTLLKSVTIKKSLPLDVFIEDFNKNFTVPYFEEEIAKDVWTKV